MRSCDETLGLATASATARLWRALPADCDRGSKAEVDNAIPMYRCTNLNRLYSAG